MRRPVGERRRVQRAVGLEAQRRHRVGGERRSAAGAAARRQLRATAVGAHWSLSIPTEQLALGNVLVLRRVAHCVEINPEVRRIHRDCQAGTRMHPQSRPGCPRSTHAAAWGCCKHLAAHLHSSSADDVGISGTQLDTQTWYCSTRLAMIFKSIGNVSGVVVVIVVLAKSASSGVAPRRRRATSSLYESCRHVSYR